jgi:putative sigma-54 modulation protein
MNQKVDTFTKNLELTDAIRDYILKKTGKLDRFLKEIEDIRIDLSYSKTARNTKERYISQITLRGRGFILRAEERSDDLYSAIDLMVNKIQRQIERYKGKRYRSLSSIKPIIEKVTQKSTEIEPQEISSPIVRRKRFKLIPMDELEAIEQMNLLSHEDFFIFFNVKSQAINVLYRRRDGNYGIIEPEI